MTYLTNCTLPDSLLEQIAEEALAILPELICIVVNAAMQAECEQHLGAATYERTDTRWGHANGCKPKTVTTRVGPVTFEAPQMREGGFYPEALERGLRTAGAADSAGRDVCAGCVDLQGSGHHGAVVWHGYLLGSCQPGGSAAG